MIVDNISTRFEKLNEICQNRKKLFGCAYLHYAKFNLHLRVHVGLIGAKSITKGAIGPFVTWGVSMVLVYSSWLADRALAGLSIGMVTSTWRDDLVSLQHRANLIQLSFQIDRGIVPFNFQNYLLSVGIIVTGLFLILYLVALTSCGVAPFLGDHDPRTINSCFVGNHSKLMALQNTYLLEFSRLVLMMFMADRKSFAVATFVGKAAAAAT